MGISGVQWVDLPEITRADWHMLCVDVDVVIHLAAIAHTRGISDATLQTVNCDAAAALAQALSVKQRLIFLSSIRAVAGSSSSMEIMEDAEPQPLCDYGRAKRDAECAILKLRPDVCVLGKRG
jgi:UDP-glucose 4-epimerase